jgi:serine/threonine protein kinase
LNDFSSVTKEIDFYSRFYHPCLLQLQNFSYDADKNYFYIALPKGIPIRKAYHGHKIKFQEILSDLIHVVSFLNSHGVAHCDLKPGNVIFHNGRACLIDFGIAKDCLLFEDGYAFTGPAYTLGFRDPSVSFSVYNSIKCDLFALAQTMICIQKNWEHMIKIITIKI